jgi:hypothetical protein
MTTDTDLTNPAAQIAQAAGLLEAIARDSENTVDFDVPLRCGQAANRLHAALGRSATQLPAVGDDATEIAAALGKAITLLATLPGDQLTDPVLDALLDARAAAAALTAPMDPTRAVQ